MTNLNEDERHILLGMVMTFATALYNEPENWDHEAIADVLRLSVIPDRLTDCDVGEAMDRIVGGAK